MPIYRDPLPSPSAPNSPRSSYDETMPTRKRPAKSKSTPPERDVLKLQKKLSEADFLRDLERAATNRSAEKLAAASRRDTTSPKT
jgi:hypothetical protein